LKRFSLFCVCVCICFLLLTRVSFLLEIGVSKFMLLRDSDATHTSFVILNGGNPTSSKYSSYKLKIKFTNDMKGQQAPTTVWSPVSTLPMPVQDQPSTSSGSGTCLASGGSDCYDKYNENSRNGRISWTWSSAETSGGKRERKTLSCSPCIIACFLFNIHTEILYSLPFSF
jgi:hypothetical protein